VGPPAETILDRVFLEVAGVDEPSLLREDLNRSRDLSEDRAVLKKFFFKEVLRPDVESFSVLNNAAKYAP